MKGTNNIKYEQWCIYLHSGKKQHRWWRRQRRPQLMFILSINWKVLKNLVRALFSFRSNRMKRCTKEVCTEVLNTERCKSPNTKSQEECEFEERAPHDNQIKIELAIANDVMQCNPSYWGTNYIISLWSA